MITVRDNGDLPNRAECQLSIKLYNFRETVNTLLLGNMQTFDSRIFEQLIGEIVMFEIDVVSINAINSSHFEVSFFGRDGNDNTISAEKLAIDVSALTDEQTSLLAQAGIIIISVISNGDDPTTMPPPPPLVTRSFPTWAVVVIVVLNSVIIIAVLLIILGIALRRYKR